MAGSKKGGYALGAREVQLQVASGSKKHSWWPAMMHCIACGEIAVGRRPHLNVFSNHYDTRDGTRKQGYIHVADLAQADVSVLDFVGANLGCEAFNVETGTAYSVLDVLAKCSEACERDIQHVFNKKRSGDVATS